jgi:hypothetical protein
MIRIDEIYNHTFWPWFKQNRPDTRVFFCDPPGNTEPEHLFNLGRDDIVEKDFVYFHDQEPVHLDLHKSLFEEVVLRNYDILARNYKTKNPENKLVLKFPDDTHTKDFRSHTTNRPNNHDEYFRTHRHIFSDVIINNPQIFNNGHVVVSERGEHVEQLQNNYGWQSHYYFFHGWACQDWFRGYDKTFLIPRARDRAPTKTFMSPNRIVAGKRDHRVLFLYHVFKKQLEHNHISAPRICTYENVDISTVASKYCSIYPDINQVFDQVALPRLFAGEETQQMTSCWLSNFYEAADSLVYVPTETVYFGRRTHITEKTFKAIALEMPFVLVAPAGSLEYLREYGFKTFDGILDESYDYETDDVLRIEKITSLLKDLDNLTVSERKQIHSACLSIVEHNYNHFYHGGLSSILWKELTSMLQNF